MSDPNMYSIYGGLPTAKQVAEEKKAKAAQKEAQSLSSMAQDMAWMRQQVSSMEGRLAALERILYKSMQIQEKQLLTLNCLLPEGDRPLALGDREIRARQILGINVIGELVEKELTYQFKLKAKKIHPDVNNGETTEEFQDLTEAYNYLVELASS